MQSVPASATSFVGNVPENYENYMVPLFMRPFAQDLARRVSKTSPNDVLELAAGTGVLTEELRKALPQARIVPTDLNQDMLDKAKEVRPDLNVEYRTADAQELPFADASFDVVAMQFGYMFIPEIAKAVAEAYRVLKPGGRYLFNTWDSIEKNPMAKVTSVALTDAIEPGAPKFLNVPFGSYDPNPILEVLRDAGFQIADADWVEHETSAPTTRDAATGLVNGTPMYSAIVENNRDAGVIRDQLATAFAAKFGDNPMRTSLQALVFEATKPVK